MRPQCLPTTPVAVILVVLTCTMIFQAEAADHHGYKVETKGRGSECLSCHNDTVSKTISKCMPVCLFGRSHPVNQEYPPSNRKDEFKPVLVAQQMGIKFVDGRIDCISCHNLLVGSRYHLRIKNWENELCFACHQK